VRARKNGRMRRLGILLALSVVILVAAACAGQGTAAPTPTAAPPSTVTDSPTPVNNSSPGAIEGTVTGLDGQPVVGMRMGIVSGTAPYPEIGPSTDEKGYYRLSGLTPGTYEVAVHDDQGERVGLKSVVVNSGETATLDFSVSVGAATETQAPLPPLPVIRLRYSGRLHDGVEGSRCWPYKRAADGSVVGLCADTGPSPDFGEPIPVDAGVHHGRDRGRHAATGSDRDILRDRLRHPAAIHRAGAGPRGGTARRPDGGYIQRANSGTLGRWGRGPPFQDRGRVLIPLTTAVLTGRLRPPGPGQRCDHAHPQRL
jgi:hypothetical protein